MSGPLWQSLHRSGRVSWKGLGAGGTLRELVRDQPIGQAELEKLEQEAGLGRRYLAGLRREVTRLGGLAEPDLPRETMKGIVDKLEEGELQALKRAYEDRLESLWPVEPQLPNGGGSVRDDPEDRMFRNLKRRRWDETGVI